MPRLYIIGPVTGIPEDNRPAFEGARVALTAAMYEVNIPHDFVLDGLSHEAAMTISIGELVDHYISREEKKVWPIYDGVALLPGWEQSEGARLERQVAEACGIPCKTVDEWIEEAK